MARARVELSGALTFSAMGTIWKRHRPREISIPAEIEYYKRQSEFTVTMLPETVPVLRPPPKPPAAPPAVAPAVAPAAPPSPQPAPVASPPPVPPPAVAKAPEPEPPARFTEHELSSGKKAELQEIGREVFGIDLPNSMSKATMINAILEAQGS